MPQSNFFLRTKLLPPRAISELLERPRLTQKLQANLGAPITLVAADAGFGKTTLIADFVRNQTRPSVWYQLDHTDADPIVFLTYIAQGIKNIVPSFGDAIFPYLSEANEDVVRFPERAVDLLINEMLDAVEQPFILVLDDYHHIGSDTLVHKLVDRLLQYSSDLVHLIITTRDLPPLAIMRRRSQSAALVITRDDLLFTDREVRDLFQQSLSVELKDEEIAEYRGRTQGWITALQLVRQVAEQEIHADEERKPIDLHDILQQSERDIFDYFAEEVFSREPQETQELLTHLSLLETLQLDQCSVLFPDRRCSAALPELAQKNVFLTAAGDGLAEEYRLHPLFRDFLRRRLRTEIGRAKVAEEQSRIAEYFLQNKQWEMAMPFLLEAQNFSRAAEVIAKTGGEWIAAGAFTSLGLFAEKVPDEELDKFPRALLHIAEIARLQGEGERSSGILHRAVRLLNAQGDAAGEAEALHSLASVARRKAKIAEALELLERAEVLVPPDSETFMKCANTRGLCHILLRSWSEAERHFRVALELAEKLGNKHYIRLVTHNLALAPGFRGDFGEALKWFKRIFRGDAPGEQQFPQEAIGNLNVARMHLYRGEFDESESHLEKALELCQLYNLKSLRAEVFEAYGNFYREKGDLAKAGEFYERALNAYDDAEIDVSVKELNEERAIYYTLRGDTARARRLLENLIEARQKHGNDIGTNTAKLRLYQVDLAEGKTAGVVEGVSELVAFFSGQMHFYDEALSLMLLAEAHFARGEHKETLPLVQRVLDLSARYDYEYWLRTEIVRNPAIFADDEVFEKLPTDLKEVAAAASENGADAKIPAEAEPAAAAVQPFADLTVKVLGPVDIYRDAAKPFAADAWTTRRARDIFCYIATSKHRRVAKDVLIEAFWPGEDPSTVEKNFHPTISHIRKALNNRQAFKQNFIVFRDGAYQLNPELSYSIDSEEFERFIAEAEIAKREKDAARLRANLEAAHELYRGEFMSSVYDDWAEERRHFYVEQFARVVAALAKLSLSEKRWAAAIKYAGEALVEDPFREDMHRLRLKAHAAQGKPASVQKLYNELKDLMKKELGIEPSPETRRVYEELMK